MQAKRILWAYVNSNRRMMSEGFCALPLWCALKQRDYVGLLPSTPAGPPQVAFESAILPIRRQFFRTEKLHALRPARVEHMDVRHDNFSGQKNCTLQRPYGWSTGCAT
ncbi:hypothetical protein SPV1_06459 [Mariprofundus ferrooxydans PV-1]|uniref:Uncharacterized protein n=1 Tax=Mariprofundus ferrooxydans PV-1 TaxID=314345 RepID=Q0F0R5_9PROT|nr:hypothetical protein SPV1_06459 [Mariprofundus ferrooxydans PV-1]